MLRLLVSLIFVLALAVVAGAQDDPTDFAEQNNRLSFVVTGMGGLSQGIANSSENYDLLHVGVGIQYAISGSWAFRVEALPYINAVSTNEFLDDVRGFGGLGSMLYYFGEKDIRFYGEFNAGAAYFDEEVPVGGATKFNFLLGLGAGMEIPTSGNSNFILGYRYYHISNSATGDRNPGINAHTLLVGMRFGF